MKLNLEFQELEAVVRKMGAKAVSWSSNAVKLSTPDIRQILWQSLVVNIQDVEVGPHGLLTYKGEQVILYILQSGKSEYTLLHEPENSPKFHVAECRTLDNMRGIGRFDRYVVTTNTSGTFNVEFEEKYPSRSGKVQTDLHVCKNCMKKLNYKNYSNYSQATRNELVGNFDISEFFNEYEAVFKSKPKYTDKTAPSIGYSDDWAEVSNRIREQNGWKCKSCGVDCSAPQSRKLLHVHHKNGVKGDNSPSNLEVLCALCHAAQPMHKHMHVMPEIKKDIETLRLKPPLNANKDRSKTETPSKRNQSSNRYPLGESQVRQELIKLRSEIANQHPQVEPSKGILRKTMLAAFLNERITTHEAYKMKISESDRIKTSPTHAPFLEKIFSIVSKLEH